MDEFGFKKISPDNWLDPDPVFSAFAKLTPEGTVQSISSADLLRDILAPQLDETVPQEIRALFEVARGAMCYGYFFYPLFTLAYEQLFRVAETAVANMCEQLCAPKKAKSFAKKIEFLIDKSIIPEQDRIRWRGIRGLRNISSHPQDQSIVAPGNAIGSLEQMSAILNKLYGGA